eukprot:gene6688-8274_t
MTSTTTVEKNLEDLVPSSTSEDLLARTEYINTYKELLSIPLVDGAVITQSDKSTSTVSVYLSQTDYTNRKVRSYSTQRFVDIEHGVSTGSPFLSESVSALVSVSPSKSKLLQIKEPADSNNGGEFIYDIISDSRLVKSISAKDPHKKICNDEWFGRISWSPCERFVAYIADSKLNTTTFYDKEPKDKVVGDQYLQRDDWGETYSTITSPSIFVLDIESEKVIPIEPFPSDKLTAGQVIWSKDGNGLVFVAWDIKFRKLGIRACFNRTSSLYYFDFQEYLKKREASNNNKSETEKKPTKEELKFIDLIPNVKGCFRSPQFTPDGSKLIFIGFDERVYPHNTCAKIFSMGWSGFNKSGGEPPKYETIVDYKNFKDQYKGVYFQGFVANAFINDHTVLFSDENQSVEQVFALDLNTKSVKPLIFNDFLSVQSPLTHHLLEVDIKNKRFLYLSSGLHIPPSISMAQLVDVNGPITPENIKSQQVYSTKLNPKSESILKGLEYRIMNVSAEPCPAPYSHIDSFQIMYLKRKTPVDEKSGKSPLILFPHGGPHVSSTPDFSIVISFLTNIGYNIAYINYRGSTGFGKDFVDCLPGSIGTLDVKDCIRTLEYILDMDKSVDQNRVAVMGGSHGGFLSAHLASFPQFKTVVMRNPVVDIASMGTISDIPDWCFFEAGVKLKEGETDYHTLPSVDDLVKMRQCSPVANIDKVKIPVFIGLGDSDLRVPPSQGLLFYRALKERKIPTKCLWFPKTGHSLDSIEARLDQWIHVACWFNTNLLK